MPETDVSAAIGVLAKQIDGLEGRRLRLMADFGAAVWEESKDDPGFRAAHESVFLEMEQIAVRRGALQDAVDALKESELTLANPEDAGEDVASDDPSQFLDTPGQTAARPLLVCPEGHPMSPGDQFCMRCGKPPVSY